MTELKPGKHVRTAGRGADVTLPSCLELSLVRDPSLAGVRRFVAAEMNSGTTNSMRVDPEVPNCPRFLQ